MNENWNDLIQQMPGLLKELTSQPLMSRGDKRIGPGKGIYVFYENGQAIYTGRSNNLKQRLNRHCRPSSGHNSATFAFNIAKRQAAQKGINLNMTRRQLEADPTFSKLFLKAKERVSKMPIRVIRIDEPIKQTLFEVYAAIALDTSEFNDFDTH